ncbi:50S ribosomal protein L18 [Patescibacteria group bacterium]|nr:50S ribosomal protein L18 [Patescibacteria group bacterium]
MQKIKQNLTLAEKRARRVRSKISGTAERPRLTVFRSNKYTYLQVIDDQAGKTLAAASDVSVKKAGVKLDGKKMENAVVVAQELFKQLKTKKISAIRFDRGSYRYHGRLKAVADALREAGIEV